jgi:hypothetical protein
MRKIKREVNQISNEAEHKANQALNIAKHEMKES